MVHPVCLQVFKLEGLTQAARAKVAFTALELTRFVKSRGRCCRVQVYEEMKSELAIMAKPRDPNVLVVHGVYGICVATSPSHP